MINVGTMEEILSWNSAQHAGQVASPKISGCKPQQIQDRWFCTGEDANIADVQKYAISLQIFRAVAKEVIRSTGNVNDGVKWFGRMILSQVVMNFGVTSIVNDLKWSST